MRSTGARPVRNVVGLAGVHGVARRRRPQPTPTSSGRTFARQLGASGRLVPAALAAIRPGGVVVCAGIHMTDIPSFAYELLWREKKLVSVANLTRADGLAFLELAATVPLKIATEALPLAQANVALARLKQGRLQGAAVLTIDA